MPYCFNGLFLKLHRDYRKRLFKDSVKVSISSVVNNIFHEYMKSTCIVIISFKYEIPVYLYRNYKLVVQF